MSGYLFRRLGMSVVMIWMVATALFLFIHILPGDPADVILGSSDQFVPTQEQLDRVRQQLGLDQPLHVQYGRYMSQLARGDLGNSFLNRRPVAMDIRLRLGRTIQLIVPAILISSTLGITLGILAARARGKTADVALSAVALTGFSLPVFVTGNMLVLLFAIVLKWLPSSGYTELAANPGKWITYAVMPILALTLGPMASTMRMTRTSVVEQLTQDYVRTARSKGVPERKVVYKHVLKNALLPVVTVIGLQIGHMFAGTVIVEYVFNWPGLSSLLIRSIGSRDYPVIQGTVLISSFIFISINLLTDLSYSLLNPRLRYS